VQASGQLVVTASGNAGIDIDREPIYPGALTSEYERMINVGGTEPGGAMALYSNHGLKNVDILAPGSLIWSTSPLAEGGYATFSGVQQRP
jgi:subtilisin family serine protease